jgi:hypothetical protein
VAKGLVVFRWQTQTPEERKRLDGVLRPGRESSEYNAALIPTKKGEGLIALVAEGFYGKL